MAKLMNARARMERLVTGERADLIPVAFWRHFPVDDQDPYKLAAATAQFQRIFNLDLVKVSPSSSYCLVDWGVRDIWKGNPEGTREYVSPVIHTPDDWSKLRQLDVHKGFLGKQLECLQLIKKDLGDNTPIIMTVFSPLAQCKHMVGKANLLAHLRKYPQALHAGLQIITDTTAEFIRACKQTGIDGIFYAVQHASVDLINADEFQSFQKEYDQQLFPIVSEFWLNLLHIHGRNIHDGLMNDYPMQIFNWHDRETSPDLKTGLSFFNKIVCGGLNRTETMLLGDELSIRREVEDAIQQTSGAQFVLGTGCVMMQTTPFGNIKAAIDCARSIPT